MEEDGCSVLVNEKRWILLTDEKEMQTRSSDVVSVVLGRGEAVILVSGGFLKSYFPNLKIASASASVDTVFNTIVFGWNCNVVFKRKDFDQMNAQEFLEKHSITDEEIRFAEESGFDKTREFELVTLFKDIQRFFERGITVAAIPYVKSMGLLVEEWGIMENKFKVRRTKFLVREAAFGTPDSYEELISVLGLKGGHYKLTMPYAVDHGNIEMVEYLWRRLNELEKEDLPAIGGCPDLEDLFPQETYWYTMSTSWALRQDFEATSGSMVRSAHRYGHSDILRFFRKLVDEKQVREEEIDRVDRALKEMGV